MVEIPPSHILQVEISKILAMGPKNFVDGTQERDPPVFIGIDGYPLRVYCTAVPPREGSFLKYSRRGGAGRQGLFKGYGQGSGASKYRTLFIGVLYLSRRNFYFAITCRRLPITCAALIVDSIEPDESLPCTVSSPLLGVGGRVLGGGVRHGGTGDEALAEGCAYAAVRYTVTGKG